MQLSIITVNLNNKHGLKKTIESVLSQTWTDFEYLIIDGASTDGSKGLLEDYKDYGIKWISEPDTGIFNAMNKGIKIAKGEYLLFLNSGDYLVSDNVLKEIFSSTKKYSEDFICARCALEENDEVIFVTNPPEKITFRNFYNTSISHQSTFIKRILFDKYGLYREDLKLKSDWEFFVKTLILNNCTSISLNTLTTKYNMQGVSNNPENKQLQQREIQKVYDETCINKFINDYDFYMAKIAEMKVYKWADNNFLIRVFVHISFQLAQIFRSKSK